MALYTGRILMRIGNEANYDIDKLMPGEWAVSTDKRIVRICVSAGIGIRMATYEAFEEDMAKIEKILNQCQTIQEAIVRINTEVSEKADAVAEYTASAKQYRDEAEQFKNEAEQFKDEAEQFKDEAFSTTPEGYENLVQTVADNTVKIDTVINKAELNIKNTASGDSIHLTDSADSKAVEFALYGKAKQYTTTGKSLAKLVLSTVTSSGVKFTVDEKGIVNINGVATAEINFSVFSQFIPNFTGLVKLTGSTSNDFNMYPWDNTLNTRAYADSSKTEKAVNQNAINKESIFYVEQGHSYSVFSQTLTGSTLTNVQVKPMLRLAEVEDDTYEPYTNGVSPNPDYPQEIEVSGASGSVKVMSCGKNFYDVLNTDLKPDYSRFEKGDNWLRVYSETAYSYVSAGKYVDYNKMKVGKTYTFSAYVTVTKGVGALSLRDKNAKILFSTGNINSSGRYKFTFVLPYSEEAYFSFFATMGTAEIGDVTYSNIQVEEGNSRTEYEPYKEIVSTIPTPNGLAGIPVDSGGNYTDADGQQWICDEIVKYADGTGERVHRIGKNVGDDCFYSVDSVPNTFFINGTTKELNNDGIEKHIMCNLYSVSNLSNMGDNNISTYTSSNGSKMIAIKDTDCDTLESFKTLINSKSIIIYYVYETPIRTPLTAEEIAEIEKLHTFYPVTNISNDAGCGMKVTYLADSKNYIDNQLALQAQAQEAAMINMLLLLPEETQAAMIENDTNNLLTESEE